tara:strand:+ start:571 stop:1197 length:627 start_codon:yes stop_codon:yes gene_type:complete
MKTYKHAMSLAALCLAALMMVATTAYDCRIDTCEALAIGTDGPTELEIDAATIAVLRVAGRDTLQTIIIEPGLRAEVNATATITASSAPHQAGNLRVYMGDPDAWTGHSADTAGAVSGLFLVTDANWSNEDVTRERRFDFDLYTNGDEDAFYVVVWTGETPLTFSIALNGEVSLYDEHCDDDGDVRGCEILNPTADFKVIELSTERTK